MAKNGIVKGVKVPKVTHGTTYRSSSTGRLYSYNTVAAARVAVKASKLTGKDAPTDIVDIAESTPTGDFVRSERRRTVG